MGGPRRDVVGVDDHADHLRKGVSGRVGRHWPATAGAGVGGNALKPIIVPMRGLEVGNGEAGSGSALLPLCTPKSLASASSSGVTPGFWFDERSSTQFQREENTCVGKDTVPALQASSTVVRKAKRAVRKC